MARDLFPASERIGEAPEVQMPILGSERAEAVRLAATGRVSTSTMERLTELAETVEKTRAVLRMQRRQFALEWAEARRQVDRRTGG